MTPLKHLTFRCRRRPRQEARGAFRSTNGGASCRHRDVSKSEMWLASQARVEGPATPTPGTREEHSDLRTCPVCGPPRGPYLGHADLPTGIQEVLHVPPTLGHAEFGLSQKKNVSKVKQINKRSNFSCQTILSIRYACFIFMLFLP